MPQVMLILQQGLSSDAHYQFVAQLVAQVGE